MEAEPRIIEVYVTRDGKLPFSEWLASLKDVQARAKIRIRLDRVSLGNLGDCKSVGSGVLELRINYGPGYRVYLGQEGKKVIVLLIGGNKSTQHKDILRAQSFWLDYRSREDENKKISR